MRIEKLTLKGFLRFRDPLTIDLSTLPAGLIAITGENGAGKSTLLEAVPAALYRSFLSRGDLVDYATGPDSYLDVQIALEGRGAYRARVNVDGVKRGSDAVLERLEAGNGRRALNDGKVSTYDTVVAELFPSKAQLLASAFAAQNKAGSFIALDKKTRKTLFMQLLGIERYLTMSETARQAAGLIEQTRTTLTAVRDALAQTGGAHALEAIDAEIAEAQAHTADAEARRAQLRVEIQTVEARLATMQDAVAAYGAATLRVATLREQLRGRELELAGVAAEAGPLQARADAELRALDEQRRADLQAIATAVQQADAVRARETDEIAAARLAEVQACETKIAGNHQIQAMADQIRTAVAELVHLDATIAGLADRVRATDAALLAESAALAPLELELRALGETARDLERARRDANLLITVPCGGRGAHAACAFLTNAQEAAARIPQLQATVADSETRLHPRLAAVRQAIEAKRAAIHQDQAALTDHEARREALRAQAKYADALSAADARIAELTERQRKADRDATTAWLATDARHTARVQELRQREAASDAHTEARRADILARCAADEQQRAARQEGLTRAVDVLTRDLAAADEDLVAASASHQRAAAVTAELAQLRHAWDVVTGHVATYAAACQALSRRRAEAVAAQTRIAALDARLAELATDLVEWQGLAKAFSRDGLPVLEIDAAGPTISALTTDLLTACFGARFSVELVTQQAKADGKGVKESFTVAVTDNSAGDTRDIADLSGGEQVIVAEALMAATAVFVNQRSVAPVRTCWRDETTGALDPENSQRYLAMLRRLHELGGFEKTLFISHNPDISAQADAQIQLRDGVATVAYPPFSHTEAA